MILDFFEDYFGLILIVILIVILVFVANYQAKDKIACEKAGGVVIEKTFGGYQCLTKKDIEKLRGGK